MKPKKPKTFDQATALLIAQNIEEMIIRDWPQIMEKSQEEGNGVATLRLNINIVTNAINSPHRVGLTIARAPFQDAVDIPPDDSADLTMTIGGEDDLGEPDP